MKIGDRVRFLNETGGGRVAGFQGKNIVLVEDEDGFQVPMMTTEVVVVGDENYDTSHVVAIKQQQAKGVKETLKKTDEEQEPADRPITFKAAPQERRGGDQLSAYLAFVPMDVKELSQTRFEAYFVNDSNYYMRFTYLSAEGSGWHLRATMEVEPNTKVFIEEFGRENLQQLERVGVQMVAYKRDKPFLLKPTIDVQLRVDGVKFYKLHTFQDSDFFEQPALVYTLVENDKPVRPLVIDAKTLMKSLTPDPSIPSGARPPVAFPKERGVNSKSNHSPLPGRGVGGEAIVVDLHASELLETTTGMGPTDILNYQLDVMRKTLKQYEKQKGTKIIFIHGKGEGVLRKAIVNELQYRYKSYTYQDASFREYGYGATQVTIR